VALKYLLTVLGNGRSQYLERCMSSIEQFLHPRPTDVFSFTDHGSKLGMCAAHWQCWQAAADSEYEWVFHIEEDYVLLGPVHLWDLAKVMDRGESSTTDGKSFKHGGVLQMALMRTPWGAEVEYGGYVAQNPVWYTRVYESLGWGEGEHWIAQRRNWTNAPALFRTSLAREFPWDPNPGCETEIGPRILAKYPEAVFGIFGGGECQAAHIGIERARGAQGY
jgi:hypothetical protein